MPQGNSYSCKEQYLIEMLRAFISCTTPQGPLKYPETRKGGEQ